MLHFILLKIRNKYKLYLCLLIGLVFINAVISLVVMFRVGSINKLIQRSFVESYEKSGSFPAVLTRAAVVDSELYGGSLDKILSSMDSYEESWSRYLEIPIIAKEKLVYIRGGRAVPYFVGSLPALDIGYMNEIDEHTDIEDGVRLGEDMKDYLPEGYMLPENSYPCYVSEYTADTYQLVVGELLTFNNMNDAIQYNEVDKSNDIKGANTEDEANGDKNSEVPGTMVEAESDASIMEKGNGTGISELNLYIAGIITEKTDDYYWNKSLRENGHMLYVDKRGMADIIEANPSAELMAYEMQDMVDYRYINNKNAVRITSIIRQFHEKDELFGDNILSAFSAYENERASLMAILYVIALPLVAIVLVFIAMISIRIVDSELGEIAGFASRGISRRKIISMYLIQETLCCIAAYLPGLALGYLMGKAFASAEDFLSFDIGKMKSGTRAYGFTWQMLPAGALALMAAMVIMTIPVIVKSRSTLVDHHEVRSSNRLVPLWEKYCLDVILLALSLYLLRNYNIQLSSVAAAVLEGRGVDPMIFMDAMLFIVAAGLIILRLIFYGVRLFYRLFGRKLGPVGYAGIIQIMRTRRRTGIISLFMVVTVAMSLFNANMARTINANSKERLKLDLGADYIVREHFDMRIKGQQPPQTWKYIEPDAAVYDDIAAFLSAASYTKVIRDDNTEVRAGAKAVKKAILMGINTKEFGLTANMVENTSGEHWYNYLNAMAAYGSVLTDDSVPDGLETSGSYPGGNTSDLQEKRSSVIAPRGSLQTDGCVISRNLAEKLGVSVGDTFTYSRTAPVDSVGIYASATGRVAAIVDMWPGYERYIYSYNDEGKLVENEQYLVVANYASVINTFGITPYEIWMKFSEVDEKTKQRNLSPDEVEAFIRDRLESLGRHIDSFDSGARNIQEMKSSALIQITNGLFTADFLVALFLCILGFGIHWISSIKDRELLFGIYRAMGISVKEIEKMLLIEQAFLTFISIFAGVISGGVATKLFAGIFAAFYLPKKHSIPLLSIIAMQDIMRLFVVLAAAVILVMFVISRIVKRLDIAEALKLGGD